MADVERIAASLGLGVWDVDAGVVTAVDGTADWLAPGSVAIGGGPSLSSDDAQLIAAHLVRAASDSGGVAVAVLDATGSLVAQRATPEGSPLAAIDEAHRVFARLPFIGEPAAADAAVRVLVTGGQVAGVVAVVADGGWATVIAARRL